MARACPEISSRRYRKHGGACCGIAKTISTSFWRTQRDIAQLARRALDAFAENLIIEARVGKDNVLMAEVGGGFVKTAAFEQFRQQANDLRIEVVAGDNLAHLFGGNENDKGQTTTFINALRARSRLAARRS